MTEEVQDLQATVLETQMSMGDYERLTRELKELQEETDMLMVIAECLAERREACCERCGDSTELHKDSVGLHEDSIELHKDVARAAGLGDRIEKIWGGCLCQGGWQRLPFYYCRFRFTSL